MAYFSTEPASERRNVTGKYRVWNFFSFSSKTHPANRLRPAQPRRKIRPTPTKTASGIPYWPSRDPIGERGGVNLYGFVHGDPLGLIDYLGRESKKFITFEMSYNDTIHEEDKARTMKVIAKELAFLNKKLAECCSEYTLNCNTEARANGDMFGKKAPIGSPSSGYDPNSIMGMKEIADALGGKIGDDGKIPLLLTNGARKGIDSNGSIAGGRATAVGSPSVGVLMDVSQAGDGNNLNGENALAHELGHAAGATYDEIEDNPLHMKDPPEDQHVRFKDRPLMAVHGGEKVDKCWCTEVAKLAR